MVRRRLCPSDGSDGTQGQGPNTPQNDGLHGAGSNTLHGALGLSGSTAATGCASMIAPATAAATSNPVRNAKRMLTRS